VHLLDEVIERVSAERLVAATLIAGNVKPKGGGDFSLPDPDEARRRFDAMLISPLDIEEQREAILKAVAAA
jgi:hypothetical protein